jgi:hypothetical protein
MNKLYIMMLLLVTMASCSKDPAENPAPEQYLKSTTAYMTFYKDGQLDHLTGRQKWGSELYTYDGLVSEREFREDHDLDGPRYWLAKELNTYENGVLIIRTILSPRTNTTKYTYSYSSGRLTERKEYGDSGELYKFYTYEYTNGQHPHRMLEYYAGQPSPFATYTYTYDNRGNITKQHRIYFNGVESTLDRAYDERGNLIRETLDIPGMAEPRIMKLSKYTYDAKGRITEREFSTYLDMDYQKWVYHYYGDAEKHINAGKLKSIDVMVATAPNVYESRGLITYHYEYLRK